MDSLPSQELLDNTHTFPGPFVFKAIGRNDNAFVAEVVAIVRSELSIDLDPPFRLQPSSRGNHVSITLTPEVESSTQVLAIYARIRTIDGLIMLL